MFCFLILCAEDLELNSKEANTLVLTEGAVLGGGAFSRVSIATEESTGRSYAMKRMRKSAVVQCPEHVFCEQLITKNTAHPFCIRQYASFQDKYHLYFLFDLMPGGDLMDVLVAEAKVIKQRVPSNAWQVGGSSMCSVVEMMGSKRWVGNFLGEQGNLSSAVRDPVFPASDQCYSCLLK